MFVLYKKRVLLKDVRVNYIDTTRTRIFIILLFSYFLINNPYESLILIDSNFKLMTNILYINLHILTIVWVLQVDMGNDR